LQRSQELKKKREERKRFSFEPCQKQKKKKRNNNLMTLMTASPLLISIAFVCFVGVATSVSANPCLFTYGGLQYDLSSANNYQQDYVA